MTKDPPKNYVERFKNAGGNFPAIISDLENNPKFKKRVKQEAERLNIDPNLLWTNFMEEGAYTFFRIQEDLNEEGVNWEDSMYSSTPVEFMYAGLDTVGSRLDDFVERGYISEDLANQYENNETYNERGEKVSSATSNKPKEEAMLDAVTLQAAEIKDRQRKFTEKAEQIGYDLSNNDINYLTYLSYNAGAGAANEVLEEAKNSNIDSISSYINDTSIDEGYRGEGKKISIDRLPDLNLPDLNEARQNTDRRVRNEDALKAFDLFGTSKENWLDEVGYKLNKSQPADIQELETNQLQKMRPTKLNMASELNTPVQETQNIDQRKMFLGGVVDAIGSAATAVGDFAKENPKLLGTAAGLAAAPFTGGLSLAAGASLGGTAGTAASQVTGDATGQELKRAQAEEKRRRQIRRQRLQGQQRVGGQTTGSIGMAYGGVINPTERRRPIEYGQRGQGRMAYGGTMKKYKSGGTVSIGQDAQKFVGPSHEQGGVDIDQNTEVEGGETMDNVGDKDYIFSKRVSIPKEYLEQFGLPEQMSFAEAHQKLIEGNAPEDLVNQLAQLQEQVTGRNEQIDNNTQNNPIRYSNNQTKQPVIGGRKQPTKYATGGFNGPEPVIGDNLENLTLPDSFSTELPLSDVLSLKSIPDPKVNTNNVSSTNSVDNVTDQSSVGNSNEDGSNFIDSLTTGLNYLPGMMNLTRGLFGNSDIEDVPYTPVSRGAETTIEGMETDVDITEQRNTINRRLRSIFANSESTVNQKRLASARAAEQLLRLQSQQYNQETTLKNQKLGALARAQQANNQRNAQAQTQADQATRRQRMMADEARAQLRQTGLSQVAQTFQEQQRYEDMLKNDEIRFKTLVESLPAGPKAKNEVLRRLIEQHPEEREYLEALMVPTTSTTT